MEIMAHPWWAEVDWKKLEKKEVIPPFKPNLGGEKWLQNFDEEFVKEGLKNEIKGIVCQEFNFFLFIEAINSCVTDSNLKLLKEYDDEFSVFDAKDK